MRKLLLLSAVCVLGLAPAAAAQEPTGPVVAAEFAESFPALLPIEQTTRTHPTASGALGPDERVLAVASFWLLLGSLAIWRVTRRRPEHDPTPVTGWVLGYAPPLPR